MFPGSTGVIFISHQKIASMFPEPCRPAMCSVQINIYIGHVLLHVKYTRFEGLTTVYIKIWDLILCNLDYMNVSEEHAVSIF
jgi:hypothetical protein